MLDDVTGAAIGLFMALEDGAVVLEVLDDDLRIVAVNPAMAALFGIDAASLRGRLGSELYPPAELADVVRRARETLAGGHPTDYEAVRELPQGRRVVRASMIPVGGDRILAYGRDVSDQVEATRKLEELETLADIGSWDWNLIDDTLQWSAQYRRIIGLREDEPASMDRVLELIHPDDLDRVTGRIDLVSSGRDVVRGVTYRVVRPDGEVRVVQGRGEVVTDDAGNPIRMFGTVQDVTDVHRAEEDRQRLQRAIEGQRQALELNDNVVQGLSAAWLAFELGQVDEGVALVRRTTSDAQELVTTALREAARDEPIGPGDLARAAPANVESPDR
ncbi:PAS domain-containing protein [Egicoccus sp. AB-alg6-2]|uniref:PAS domain-containing protein n=1 Tax=Egicoccus sp. AB-alg6-2 TaxID=3242692 RepID=UPI00359ECB64